jgi:hypothetical protein
LLRENIKKYSLTNVDITAVSKDLGVNFEFAADTLTIKMITNAGNDDVVFSTEVQAEIECVHPNTLRGVVQPDSKVEPVPKYNAAMGDAAQAYCDELNAAGSCSGFRWEEVWKRMWEAQKK